MHRGWSDRIIHWIGGCVDTRVALDTLKESLLPSRESNHDFLLSHPLA
jgi:hypothetical protein